MPPYSLVRSGSGFIIVNFVNMLNKQAQSGDFYVKGIATDINFDACFLTKRFSDINNVDLSSLNTFFLQGIAEESLDIVICNPVKKANFPRF